jgi:hypothetical protein
MVVLLALGLLLQAHAEVISTGTLCHPPADLAESPDVAARPLKDLNAIELPRVTIDVKRDLPMGHRTFAEAMLARLSVDPQGGSIAVDGDGRLFASSPAVRCAD